MVQCLLISFCFGSEILKKIGPPQPPKKTPKHLEKTYGFSRWNNLPTLWVRRLRFGIVLSNIFLLWIWMLDEIWITLTSLNPPSLCLTYLCDPSHTALMSLSFLLFRTGFDKSFWQKHLRWIYDGKLNLENEFGKWIWEMNLGNEFGKWIWKKTYIHTLLHAFMPTRTHLHARMPACTHTLD